MLSVSLNLPYKFPCLFTSFIALLITWRSSAICLPKAKNYYYFSPSGGVFAFNWLSLFLRLSVIPRADVRIRIRSRVVRIRVRKPGIRAVIRIPAEQNARRQTTLILLLKVVARSRSPHSDFSREGVTLLNLTKDVFNFGGIGKEFFYLARFVWAVVRVLYLH